MSRSSSRKRQSIDPERVRAILTPIMRVVASLTVLFCLGKAAAHFAEQGREDERFLVDPSTLVDEGVPDWVPAPVVASIQERLKGLPPVPIFAQDFAERIRNEVSAASAWIADVRRVDKVYPNRARLELRLRKPVASVDLAGQRFLLDGKARVIHEESSYRPSAFPFVVFPVLGAQASRRPVVGRTFPDHEVVNAVYVAMEMHGLRAPYRDTVLQMDPVALQVRAGAKGMHPGEVIVRSGLGDTLLRWGRPGRFLASDGSEREWGLLEPSIEKKVTHLAQLMEVFPRLDGLVEVRLDFDKPWYRAHGSAAVQFLESDWVETESRSGS